MPKFLIAIIACIIAFSINASAQTDTSYLDLGRVRLNKQFTQTVTIKGEDLERFPFTNLADAINVWLYGTNAAPATLTYVIDGFQVNDVNNYPVHDIETVTLVQNALAQINGQLNSQQMVVIKLRKNLERPSGFTASGQTSFINLQNSLSGATDNGKLYNNYYVAGFKNTEQLHYGLSANYLGDSPITPVNAIYNRDKSASLNRFRFNGYFSTSQNKPTHLDIQLGYAPQQLKHSETYKFNKAIEGNYKLNEDALNASLSLVSNFKNGFSNNLKVAYNTIGHDYDNVFNSNLNTVNYYASNGSFNNLFVADEIRYTKTAGEWQLEPAIAITYQHKSNATDSTNNYQQPDGKLLPGNKNTYTESAYWYAFVPYISATYKNILNITGGFNYISDYSISAVNGINPFISASVNVMQLVNEGSKNSLIVYGSYSRAAKVPNYSNTLTDYRYMPYNNSYFNNPAQFDGENVTGVYPAYNHKSNDLRLGLNFKPSDRLSISYQFEDRTSLSFFIFNYTDIDYTVDDGITPGYIVDDFADDPGYHTTLNTQYININYQIISGEKFNWLSSINGNITSIKYASTASKSTTTVGNQIKTGGWVNRINAGKLIAGLDVLYQFGGHLYNSTDKINSFNLQNVYLGAKVKSANNRVFELYASGRNMLQNNQSIITDGRRFFGLGFKVDL